MRTPRNARRSRRRKKNSRHGYGLNKQCFATRRAVPQPPGVRALPCHTACLVLTGTDHMHLRTTKEPVVRTLIEADKKNLRDQLEEKKALLDRIQNSVKDETGKGHFVVTSEQRAEFQKALAEVKEIRGHLNAWGEYEELDSYLNSPAPNAGGSLVVPQQRALAAPQTKSIGQRFIESKAFQDRGPDGVMRAAFILDEDLTSLERKDIYTAAGGTRTRFSFGQTQTEQPVIRPYRTDRVRDLFPVAGTSANLIEYLRVLGYLDGVNNARTVPEREGTAPNQVFGLKPHTSLAFAPASAPVRTIAHYEVAHRNTLNDMPMLRSIIDNELLYGLRLVEDDQILNGDGNGENLLGILETPGIQEYPGPGLGWGQAGTPVLAEDTVVDAVRRAATRVMLAYYSPTGVVVHPFDWERMETIKDANGNYILALNVAVGAEKRIWQMPVVASPAMTQGTALTGAFGLGAKVYDREQSNIRVAEQHSDFFIRNAVAILAEQRLALTVSRPESFVKINLTTGVDSS